MITVSAKSALIFDLLPIIFRNTIQAKANLLKKDSIIISEIDVHHAIKCFWPVGGRLIDVLNNLIAWYRPVSYMIV